VDQFESKENLPVAVVGAGPAGLAAARALKNEGLPFEILEQYSDAGGIWDVARPDSPMYQSAHFISSRDRSAFAGFPFPKDVALYPSHQHVLKYLRNFAKAYGLNEHIQYNAEVTGAWPEAEAWTLKLKSGAEKKYSALILATGSTWFPRMPDYQGEFSGEMRHSVDYCDPGEFSGKKVLIVGGGNSAVDIACDAAKYADQSWISLRRGYHFVPKLLMGTPMDVLASRSSKLPMRFNRWVSEKMIRLHTGPLESYGLPKPDHRLFATHPIMNTQILHHLAHGDIAAKPDVQCFSGTQVVFTDNTSITPDLVILATGYEKSVPFIADQHTKRRGKAPDFLLRMISEEHDNLFGLSYFETNSGIYPLFDRMAHLIARSIARGDHAKAVLKFKAKQLDGRMSKGLGLVDSDRHKTYVNSITFSQTLDSLCADMGWPTVQETYKSLPESEKLMAFN